jgi:hypothetical protein
LTSPPPRVYRGSMAIEDERRQALIEAAQLARVRPGLDYDEAVAASDNAAAHLLDFMRRKGDFAIGLLQAASYMLCGANRNDYDVLYEVDRMTDRAIRAAPRNPDVLRRAFTIFQRLTPDPSRSERDIILPDANWETLPARDLLE